MDEEFDRSQYSSASISPDATFLERVGYGAGKQQYAQKGSDFRPTDCARTIKFD